MHLQPMRSPVPMGPCAELAERDRRGVDETDHRLALLAQLPVGKAGEERKSLGKYGGRPTMIGIGEGGAGNGTASQVVMMMGVGQPASRPRRLFAEPNWA